tara:strand:+ start:2822 stop:3019 length:198 start_codon:yes stop_codon:yes gene_type:complete
MKLNNEELIILEKIVRRELNKIDEKYWSDLSEFYLDEFKNCSSLYDKIQDLHLDQLPNKYPWKVA